MSCFKSSLIIKVPGETTGVGTDKVVSSVDIYPTIVDFCGLEMPHQTDGKSLRPLLDNNDSVSWQEQAYGFFNEGISLRTQRYRLTKYFRNQQPVIELYDHQTDPNETKNIAEESPDVVEELMPLLGKGNRHLF